MDDADLRMMESCLEFDVEVKPEEADGIRWKITVPVSSALVGFRRLRAAQCIPSFKIAPAARVNSHTGISWGWVRLGWSGGWARLCCQQEHERNFQSRRKLKIHFASRAFSQLIEME